MKYKIVGGNLPAVHCILKKDEYIYCESGAMAWKDSQIKMQTTTAGIGKAFARMFAGERFFRNKYIAIEDGEITLSSSFPGEIKDIRITPANSIVAQKKSFLGSSSNVDTSVYIKNKLSFGLFGGEGFIMQKFKGNGVVFLEVDGSCIEYELKEGEKKIVDTGYLVAIDDTCKLKIELVKGIKNIIFGNEGLFNTVVVGPGKVYLQTMPIKKMANIIYKNIPNKK